MHEDKIMIANKEKLGVPFIHSLNISLSKNSGSSMNESNTIMSFLASCGIVFSVGYKPGCIEQANK